MVNFAWREGFGIQRNVHFMKLWCTLLQFWIPNPGEFSSFFPENAYFVWEYFVFCSLFFLCAVCWYLHQLSSVQSLSRVRLFVTPWIAARQASLSITNSQSLLKLLSIESVMPSTHLILCRPLLLLPPIPPSIRVLSSESPLRMRWPKSLVFISWASDLFFGGGHLIFIWRLLTEINFRNKLRVSFSIT